MRLNFLLLKRLRAPPLAKGLDVHSKNLHTVIFRKTGKIVPNIIISVITNIFLFFCTSVSLYVDISYG